MIKTSKAMRVFALCFVAAFARQLPAQPTGGVVGEVMGLPAGGRNYQVEIRPVMGGGNAISDRAMVESSGRFHFWRVPAGQYEFVLLDDQGNTVARELISVADTTGPVQLRVKGQRGQQEAKPQGTISLTRLQHKVPKEAGKAFKRAGSHRKKKRLAEAESAYCAAIAIDPEFVEAINDLATLYYSMGKYSASLAVIEKARKLDPDRPNILANTSAAMMALGRAADAEPLVRRAVAGDPQSVRSRYLLGLSLAAQRKNGKETEDLLEESAPLIPQARLALAQVHMAKGDREGARLQLQRYLETGRPEQRLQAQGWLNALR